MGGGGGGPSAPTQQTITQSNIPDWLRPQVETTLGGAMQQMFQTSVDPTTGNQTITGVKPFTPYGAGATGPGAAYNPMTGQYDFSQGAPGAGAGAGADAMQTAQAAVAGYTPMQQQAMQGIAGLQMPGQYGAASDAAMRAIQGGFGASQYQPGYFGNQFQAPPSYSAAQFTPQNVQAQQLQQYQMDPAQLVGTQQYTGANVGQYMSPYMQNVVDVQQQEAKRQSDIAGTQLASQASQAGAFGGSRYGIQEAERQRNLATQLGQIQATGSQAAFQNAQQQFNAQQQANLQAALANQQAGLTVGQQNLAAKLGVQQLGAGQNLQAQLANQQALQAAQAAAEQSRQFGAGQGMTAAQQAAQYGLSGQQLGEQSRQFGANLGLQGLQSALQGASTLGALGGQQLQAQQGIFGLQQQAGAQQQAQQQAIINQALQNYAQAQQFPLQTYNAYNALLRGYAVPGQSATTYQAPPSAISQLAGLGTAGIAGYKLANMKKGGKVKKNSGIVGIGLQKAMLH